MQKIDSTSDYRPRVGGHEGQMAMKLTKGYQCQWSLQDGDVSARLKGIPTASAGPSSNQPEQ